MRSKRRVNRETGAAPAIARRKPTAPDAPLATGFARAREAASGLPEVEPGTCYGTSSLKVRGTSFMRVKDADTLVIMCPVEEKEMLMEAAPEIYFETDHYKGWPAVLVRVANIGEKELRHRLERAWRMKAPKRVVREFDAEGAGDAGREKAGNVEQARGRAKR